MRRNKLVSRLSGCPVNRFNRQTGKPANRQTKNAFTLIELLIVSVMIPMVAFAVYSGFDNGIKIWQRINKEIPGEDLNIFFDKFALDLRNSFKFSGIKFLGKENEVGFASIVNSRRMEKVTVGEVVYYYNDKNYTLSREEKDFSCVYSENKGAARQLLKNVKSLRFQYYFYDAQNKEYLWLDGWLKDGLPLAVRVELELKQAGRMDKYIRTVSIPVSE